MTLTILFILLLTRGEREIIAEYIDDSSILLRILSKWIKYYMYLKDMLKLHESSYVNLTIWILILIILCYVAVIYSYGE